MPTYTDTFGKIVSYFAMVTTEPFEFNGKTYEPKPLRISPDIARGYTCPEGCGGCCPKFSLDYLMGEERPPGTKAREMTVNGVTRVIMSDMQEQDRYHCKYLNHENGRCGIHEHNPFSCDFELIRFAKFAAEERPNQVTTRLFGRGWQLLKVNGERGADCEMLPITDESRADTIRKLKRLERWAREFGLKTKIKAIIEWLETEPKEAIVL